MVRVVFTKYLIVYFLIRITCILVWDIIFLPQIKLNAIP